MLFSSDVSPSRGFPVIFSQLCTRLSSALLAALALSACVSQSDSPTPESLAIARELTPALPAQSPQALSRIAFGSCNKQNLPQPLWRKLGEEAPELFVWTGDVVYADTRDMGKLAGIYRQQLEQPEYRTFLASGSAVIGVYDDHDYGENNGDSSYPPKATAQKLFLDFIGEPVGSARRAQEGIYTSYLAGPAGQRVKFIMLDTRYHRSEEGTGGDLLGAAQWQWLSSELQKRDAELVLVISSIQVLPFEHRFEKWANFPASRQRLLEAIDRSPAPNIALISGDRHFAEISQLKLPSGRELWEFTSSGLTHSYQAFDPAKNINSLRVGPAFTRLNYGWLDIDWQKGTLAFAIKDINKSSELAQTIPLKK